ncbi:hypothetical protein ACS0TY_003318 [Phlomoides rotata]
MLKMYCIISLVQAVVSGCSAGGLVSILNCDRFKALIPASTNAKCFADAGYFINVRTSLEHDT